MKTNTLKQTHTKKNKYGFTLVELIVVITILVILGTIGFLSLGGYSSNARDSDRVSAISNIKKSLDLTFIKTSSYPTPTNGTTVTFSGGTVWTQGSIGNSVLSFLSSAGFKFSKIPTDPTYQNTYTYSLLNTGKEYQIATIMENKTAYQSVIPQTYAADSIVAYVGGNYNGLVAKVQTGTTTYYLTLPSIILSNLTNTELTVPATQSGNLVLNSKGNLPSTYTTNGVTSTTPSITFSALTKSNELTNGSGILAYTTTGSLDTAGVSVLMNNLYTIYSASSPKLDSASAGQASTLVTIGNDSTALTNLYNGTVAQSVGGIIVIKAIDQVSIVKDINVGSSASYPGFLTNLNGNLYFSANNGISGNELWKSDGTSNGTTLVKDIYGGLSGSLDTNPFTLVSSNGMLYMRADNGINGRELWQSNGTTAGTVLLKDIRPGSVSSGPYYITDMNGSLYFTANEGTNGGELWKSDGTSTGTVLIKDIYSGANGSSIGNLTNINGIAYFSAWNGVNGFEPWKSDGTSTGTVMIKDIKTGATDGNPTSFTNILGITYFSADDGINGQELWKTDGTTAGTVLLKDIRPGVNPSYPGAFMSINGIVYFTANDGINGQELWKTDGTTAGTVLLKDINPGVGDSYGSSFININGILYFNANDGTNGAELWKTDGTTAGTVLLKDINPGVTGSFPGSLRNINGVIYFTAYTNANGTELWKSDGSTNGTVLVKDINPGTSSSSPFSLININNILYFSADDGTSGTELWKLVP